MFITKVVLKLILVCLFVGCLLNPPYNYYEFVKSAAFSTFIIIALIDYKTENYLSIPFSAIGISLFNPLYVKLTFSKLQWQNIDKAIIITVIVWMTVEFVIKAQEIYKNKKEAKIIGRGQQPLF